MEEEYLVPLLLHPHSTARRSESSWSTPPPPPSCVRPQQLHSAARRTSNFVSNFQVAFHRGRRHRSKFPRFGAESECVFPPLTPQRRDV
ncbi:hypothetical protein JOB18_041679 [Solea senegalensis]|uniref:Uncharacterized protein n=1 Tax=Solea senegalensis TaxID=28829 RepID=A0AAV6S187_SOLSE|nr:hypothetical protein JOB18_041679 [Solea senegalensis]